MCPINQELFGRIPKSSSIAGWVSRPPKRSASMAFRRRITTTDKNRRYSAALLPYERPAVEELIAENRFAQSEARLLDVLAHPTPRLRKIGFAYVRTSSGALI